MLKENVITKKLKTKGNSYFLIDSSTSDTTNDIVEILDGTNLDTPVMDKGCIRIAFQKEQMKDVSKLTESIFVTKTEL